LGEPPDRRVFEAASWRLASALVRRHPDDLRILHTHPGGGQYDCLTIIRRRSSGPGRVELNRVGSLQVVERFDGRPGEWLATWEDYLRDDESAFAAGLERGAGLTPRQVGSVGSAAALTYDVLAALAATATVHVPVAIESGYIDTSGYGGGPDPLLDTSRRPITSSR
jgi:hypothetical protein